MKELAEQNCHNLDPSQPALDQGACQSFLDRIHPDWQVSPDLKSLFRTFKFKNYFRTMAFVNVVAYIAHEQDHHPEMTVSYNQCQVNYNTHSIGGLSANDFICAAKIDKLIK